MGVVLRERPHAGEAVRHAGALEAVQASEVGVAYRQLAVGVEVRGVQERGGRAVHRLDGELLLVRVGEVHVLVVVVVVAGALPEGGVEHLRGDDLLVAVTFVEASHVGGERVVERRAAREEERARGGDGVEEEEAQLLPEPAVVAPTGLLQPFQVRLQRVLGLPRGAVDALQHLVALVAAPVRARDGHELERGDLAGRADVRAAAEVDEAVVLVGGYRLVFRDVRDDLQLERLVREVFARLAARQLRPAERRVGSDGLAHALLDALHVLGRERARDGEVVVEAVSGGWPDRELRLGEDVEHGLGHDVRGGVADAEAQVVELLFFGALLFDGHRSASLVSCYEKRGARRAPSCLVRDTVRAQAD